MDITDQVDQIKRLDRLFVAQIDAYGRFARDPSRLNYRRWLFYFEQYTVLRKELGTVSRFQS